ncbi:MAG: ATP-binding protein [Deltaproteobacteria bacterium]|nr:ATP-binding protein [Deltaproteobacteria bacterium]
MIERQLKAWLGEQVQNPQVVQIQGLRQTGKTTLMEQFREQFPGSLHYPLQNLVILQRYRGEPERWVLEIEQELSKRAKETPAVLPVFVDEVQKIPAFYQAIQGLYDAHKGRIKFWIWGSSARPIKRNGAETLAGRVFTRILWPFSQSEVFQKESVVSHLAAPETLSSLGSAEPIGYSEFLTRFFSQSLLPEPYLEEVREKSFAILESYQSTYLENEIRRENLVRDIGLFQRFLVLAASENGNNANYAAQAKVLGISPLTVQNYYHLLEDTFVCSLLPAYSQSFRVQVAKSPRICFSDVGLARFVAGERGLVHEGTAAYGKIFEPFVVMEVKKQIDYHQLPWKLFYFRTKTGVEVDLVVKAPGQTFACEIKSEKKIGPGDFRGIQKLMNLDPTIQHGIVFSLDPRMGPVAPRIYNVPVWNL